MVEYNTNNIRPDMAVLDQIIAIMERAAEHAAIAMTYFQTKSNPDQRCSLTEADLHACGNKACFAGYLGVSPEWKAYGGVIGGMGAPYIRLPKLGMLSPTESIGRWLNVSPDCLELLFYQFDMTMTNDGDHVVYNKSWDQVTADDVLIVLNRIKQAGSFRPILEQIFQANNSVWAFDLLEADNMLSDLQPPV